MRENRLASLVFMNYLYSVRIDADDIVRRFIDRHLAVCLVQLQVFLSDCYGRTLQLQHILANFYKLSDVFCEYFFFNFSAELRTYKLLFLINKK